MPKRQHSEEAVLKALQRKRVYFTYSSESNRDFGHLQAKTIVISNFSHEVGNGTNGKLDFMRKMGWKILDMRTEHTPPVKEKEEKKQKPTIKLTTYGKRK